MTIQGKVVFKNIGPGCWGIVDDKGGEWRPVNMPEQLKYQGAEVRAKARQIPEEFSIFMWGTAVQISSFETLSP